MKYQNFTDGDGNANLERLKELVRDDHNLDPSNPSILNLLKDVNLENLDNSDKDWDQFIIRFTQAGKLGDLLALGLPLDTNVFVTSTPQSLLEVAITYSVPDGVWDTPEDFGPNEQKPYVIQLQTLLERLEEYWQEEPDAVGEDLIFSILSAVSTPVPHTLAVLMNPELLKQYGIDSSQIRDPDFEDGTLLHIAVAVLEEFPIMGLKTIQYLINHPQTDTKALDDNGQTALQLAKDILAEINAADEKSDPEPIAAYQKAINLLRGFGSAQKNNRLARLGQRPPQDIPQWKKLCQYLDREFGLTELRRIATDDYEIMTANKANKMSKRQLCAELAMALEPILAEADKAGLGGKVDDPLHLLAKLVQEGRYERENATSKGARHDLIRALLERPEVDPNARLPDKVRNEINANSVWHWVLRNSESLELLNLFLRSARVDAGTPLDHGGYKTLMATPLMITTQFGTPEMMKRLLADTGASINPNYKDQNQYTALKLAIDNDSLEKFQILLAQPQVEIGTGNTSALSQATFRNQTQMMQELFASNKREQITQHELDTVLKSATQMGLPEPVKILLSYGANPYNLDPNKDVGESAWISGATKKQIQTTKNLLETTMQTKSQERIQKRMRGTEWDTKLGITEVLTPIGTTIAKNVERMRLLDLCDKPETYTKQVIIGGARALGISVYNTPGHLKSKEQLCRELRSVQLSD